METSQVLNPALNLRTHLKLRVSFNKHHPQYSSALQAFHAERGTTSTAGTHTVVLQLTAGAAINVNFQFLVICLSNLFLQL